MRRDAPSLRVHSPVVGAIAVGVLAAAFACIGCDGTAPEEATVRHTAALTASQTPLSGNSIAKFVDPLPTFNGRRSDGTTTQQITMQEFQQKVLPSSFYAGLASPF